MFKMNLCMSLDEDLLNDKETLINVVSNRVVKVGTVKNVTVERIYVFGNGEKGALLYVRNESDDEGFYRGGICLDRSEVDTVEKTHFLYVGFKDILNESASEWIDIQTPPLLEVINVVALVEVENLDLLMNV